MGLDIHTGRQILVSPSHVDVLGRLGGRPVSDAVGDGHRVVVAMAIEAFFLMSWSSAFRSKYQNT